MIRKILFVLLLSVITVAIILFMKEPAETIAIGEYKAMPHIEVTLDELNIAISDSPDDQIHVQMQGHTLKKHRLTVNKENNRFVIKEQQRKKKWQENIRFRPTPTIIVQLPKSQSKSLTLKSAYGDVTMEDVALDTVQVETSSGMAYLKNLSTSNAELHTNDGNVTIAKSALENLNIKTNAGDIAIKKSTGTAHTIQTADGYIELKEATEQPNLNIKSVSGDISIDYLKSPTSLQFITEGEDIEVTLPKYDKKTHMIGDGSNILSAKTKDGGIMIK
ncbi:DUF4097 and DUF4098 domain-containing protein YvlB [Bacillus thermophilus]|uniref:DUF4097 and DUF4098 domain-containing protein YvlB n=1 Tax=Siminovitchia thermophila TaxID=1245522 RepID=A0ABS2R1J4_9BACI|nr:DUF4097 family beta strand repeat-containing protein [Siminovitchia thermophila]MBM7713515.1 DUF4097 and DUF4098 domain-containing protein YvlB [Siminovitchia thermophila]